MFKISKCQIFDFISIVVESAVGYYLYRNNKKQFYLGLLKTINIKQIALDILLMIFISISSLIVMIFMFMWNVYILMTFIIVSILYISCKNTLFLWLFLPLYFFKTGLVDDPRVRSTIYLKLPVLVCFAIYNHINLFISIVILELVLSTDYNGFMKILFLFMNLIMIFNITKKISVNTILLLFKYRDGYIESFITRIKAIGIVCMSSILKIFSVFYLSPWIEDFIVIYSLNHDTSYFESVIELKKLEIKKCHRARFLLYPYTIIMVYFTYNYVNLTFFGTYQKIIFFLDFHIFYIEIYQTISDYYRLIDSEMACKNNKYTEIEIN
ncbi:hypothetical protein AAJ76_1400019092 [Vairimorpha ceranae]|uniref:Uncharacterized protein n=1 Tax=Vairimorpha ceranae TaxID=40302 RepID=A0A0F9ZDS8_9MICR|nr:hypothetical protein AAJ76_1400019092 [Vairimorpha ceranae]KAF5140663.1 hypothetical protein G9O61_00g011590 [Vairimorpha ceranae]KKO75684.1 hypothetical protein AAJ76_1400019092 [Vairimorpha ceranae]